MTILEMKDKRGSILEAVSTMISTAELKVRKMTEDEETEVNSQLEEVKKLDKEIRTAEEANKEKGDYKSINIITKKTEKKMEKFSIGKLLKRNMIEGRNEFAVPVGEYRAVGQEATTDAGGGYTVETEIWDLVKPLTNALVTVQAGAQIHTGLQGDIAIDTMTAPTLGWTTETGSASGTSTTFSQNTFSPKRLTATLDISKQLLNQSVFAVDQIIEQEMVRQVAVKLEGALFASESVTNAAASIMLTVTDNSGSISYPKMVDLETLLAAGNNLFGSIKYITNAAAYGIAKSTLITATYGEQFIARDGVMNGYPLMVTNSIPSTFGGGAEAGIILADWSDLHLYNFGNVDVIMDPYTQAASGKIRLVLNSYWDAGFHRTTSRKVGSISL